MSDYVLDATTLPETGWDLAKRIEKAVLKTQTGFMRPLPNELHITNAQFESIMHAKNSTSYMASVTNPAANWTSGKFKKAYLFYTPHNAMDVVIVDEPDRNLAEAGNIITE
jgi:hypothetical protein